MKPATSFYHYIYCLDKGLVIFVMGVLFLGCAVLEGVIYPGKSKKAVFTYRILMALIFLANVASALKSLIFSRSAGTYEVSMRFLYRLLENPAFEENWRTLLMNAFLFFPMGLGLTVMLPRKWNVWLRIGLTVVFGFVFSCGLEHLQFALQLGNAEVDDVVFNTVGILFGALHIALGEFLAKKDAVRRGWAWLYRK